MITNYKKFILENKEFNTLKYYIFDWDDNILIMPTVIHLEEYVDDQWKPKDVSTAEFAELRSKVYDEESNLRLIDNDPTKSYSEFRDYGPRGDNAFFEDAIKSIKNNNFGPSWDDFIECLVGGNIFMIITARGHEPESIRKVVEWIIFNYLNSKQKDIMEKNLISFNVEFGWDSKFWSFEELVDNYLNLCDFIGVYSNYFAKKFGVEGESGKPEKYKSMAIRYFSNKINDFGNKIFKKVKVGFSDDDYSTADKVNKYIKNELSLDFPIDYSVYYTKDKKEELK